MKTRQRFLYRQRADNGLPVATQINSKLHNHEFIPIVTKKHCKQNNLNQELTNEVGLYDDEYNLKKLNDFK